MDYEGRKSCIRFVFYSQSLLLFSKPFTLTRRKHHPLY